MMGLEPASRTMIWWFVSWFGCWSMYTRTAPCCAKRKFQIKICFWRGESIIITVRVRFKTDFEGRKKKWYDVIDCDRWWCDNTSRTALLNLFWWRGSIGSMTMTESGVSLREAHVPWTADYARLEKKTSKGWENNLFLVIQGNWISGEHTTCVRAHKYFYMYY